MKVTKTIEVEMMYECGRCGNSQRKKHVSHDGLIQVAKHYCGNCTKGRSLVPMSETFISVTSSEKGDEQVRQFDVERQEIEEMQEQIKALQDKLDEKEKNDAVSKQLPTRAEQDHGSSDRTSGDSQAPPKS